MKPGSYFYAIIGLLLLQLVCLELHELSHHITGRIMCGCWGTRDFYNWYLCKGCENNSSIMLATLAGPLVNIILCWGSVLFLISPDPVKKSIGLYLLFANLPIVRWLAIADGGGDEFVGVRYFFSNRISWLALRALAFTAASLLFLPPLFIAYRNMQGRWKPPWFALLCFLPGFFMTPIQNGLNRLLVKGFLSESIVLQMPVFINICFLLCLGVIWLLRRQMYLAAFYLIHKK